MLSVLAQQGTSQHQGDTFQRPTAVLEGCCFGLQVLLNNQLCESRQQLPQASRLTDEGSPADWD